MPVLVLGRVGDFDPKNSKSFGAPDEVSLIQRCIYDLRSDRWLSLAREAQRRIEGIGPYPSLDRENPYFFL